MSVFKVVRGYSHCDPSEQLRGGGVRYLKLETGKANLSNTGCDYNEERQKRLSWSHEETKKSLLGPIWHHLSCSGSLRRTLVILGNDIKKSTPTIYCKLDVLPLFDCMTKQTIATPGITINLLLVLNFTPALKEKNTLLLHLQSKCKLSLIK